MLADPQAATISGSTISLPRLEERSETNVYSSRADNVDLYVTQKVDKKTGVNRATISLVKSVIITDPITGIKSKVPYSVTRGYSIPLGITSAEVEALDLALQTALAASTYALQKKLIAGER
jgi:hypothetical protein